MTEAEQIQHFGEELDNLVARYRREYDLTYASVIGTLQMKVHCLCVDADEADDEEWGPP